MQINSSKGLPRYRVVTGKDDTSFWRRVSGAIDSGHVLHGSPAITISGDHLVLAQAVTSPCPASGLASCEVSIEHLLAPAPPVEMTVDEGVGIA